jgi:glycosidase
MFRIVVVGLLFVLSACSTPVRNTPPTPPATFAPPTLAQPTAIPTSRPTVSRPTRAPSPTSAKPAIQTPAWFNDTVLYEIFPRSFYDGSGDGIGDLKGIEQKLDYLQALGVGALWLTPIFASPSYHGYDVTDYYKINPEFGTEQDLKDLVQQAHARDIKIILDFVAGHSSDQHPFFKDAYGNPNSEYADWYRWLADSDSVGIRTHTKYEHFGSATDMPKWNQDNPATRDYLIDAAKYWMKTADIDGYRLDYALGVPHDFWKAFRQEIKSIKPDALLLGEVWDSGLKIAPYYENEFDATFDFPVYFDLMGAHNRAGSSALLGERAPGAFQTLLKAQTRLYPPGAQSVRFLGNHDTLRVMSQVNGQCADQNAECATQNLERAKLAATLLLTLPATPMLYYGEEIGMAGDKSDGDKTVREPMDWYASESGKGMTTWYNPDTGFNQPNDGISVEEQQGNPEALLEHYRALLALRAQHDALHHGEFVPVPLQGSDRATAYARVNGDEIILVVLNTAAQAVDVTLDLSTLFSGTVNFSDLLGKSDLAPAPAQKYPLRLAARSAHVLELEP